MSNDFDKSKAVALPTLCEDHWAKLRDKVKDAGLGRYVPQGGELAATMMGDQLQEGLRVGNWDPLTSCWFMITGNAMQIAGARLIGEPGLPGKCVICSLNAARNPDGSCPCPNPDCPGRAPGSIEDFERWIDNAVEGQVNYAKQKGLKIDE